MEITCTEDCRYLESGQRHPAAVVKRQIDHDLTLLMTTVGRLSEQQLQLFFLLQSMVTSFTPSGFARLTDADVADATGALSTALESASKGVIFEEASTSVPGEELRRALKPVVEEITKDGGSRVALEVAVVLRAMQRGAKHEGGMIPDGDTSYLDLVARVFRQKPGAGPASGGREGDGQKPLILLP